MPTPARLIAVTTCLLVAIGVLAPSPAPADSDARLLVVDRPTVSLDVVPRGARLAAGADVTNPTAKRQPTSNLRVYLRSLGEDPQAPSRSAVRRYRVATEPVRALAAGETVAVRTSVLVPAKVPAGTYRVRLCIERLLYRNCEFTPNNVVIAPARLVMTPAEHDFGTVEPEFPELPPRTAARRETASQVFSVTNKGVAVAGVPAFGLSGEGSEAYDIGGTTCDRVLRRNQTCAVQVTFGYSESGEYNATLATGASPGGFDTSQLTGSVQFSEQRGAGPTARGSRAS